MCPQLNDPLIDPQESATAKTGPALASKDLAKVSRHASDGDQTEVCMDIVELLTALPEPSFKGGSSRSSTEDGFARHLDDILAEPKDAGRSEPVERPEAPRQSERADREDHPSGDHDAERRDAQNGESDDSRQRPEPADRVSTSDEPETADTVTADHETREAASSNETEAVAADNDNLTAQGSADDNGAETAVAAAEVTPEVEAAAAPGTNIISGDDAAASPNMGQVPIAGTNSLQPSTANPADIAGNAATTDETGLEIATDDGSELMTADDTAQVSGVLLPETAKPIIVPGLADTLALEEAPVDLSGAAFVAQAMAFDDGAGPSVNGTLNASGSQSGISVAAIGQSAAGNANGQMAGQGSGNGLNFAPTAQAAGNTLNTPANNPEGFANFLQTATSANAQATATPAAMGQAATVTAAGGGEMQTWQTPASIGSEINGPSQTSAAQAASNTRPAFVPQQPPQVQVAVHVAQAVQQGINQIKIQLHPAELGRVDVRLDVSSDGRVAATVVADRPETLEMLRNDSRSLERALQDAGLRSDPGSLSFNLREQHHGQGEIADGSGNGRDGLAGDNDDGAELAVDDAIPFNGPVIEGNQVFDIRV